MKMLSSGPVDVENLVQQHSLAALLEEVSLSGQECLVTRIYLVLRGLFVTCRLRPQGDKLLADHHQIVEAIRSGSADYAECALVAHIGSLAAEIEQLTTHPQLLGYIERQSASVPATESARRLSGSQKAQHTKN